MYSILVYRDNVSILFHTLLFYLSLISVLSYTVYMYDILVCYRLPATRVPRTVLVLYKTIDIIDIDILLYYSTI